MPALRIRFTSISIVLAIAALTTASLADDPAKSPAAKSSEESPKADKDGWKPLFNGKDLTDWKSTNFGGEGEVYVENGDVVITPGVDLSGITSTRRDIPKSNYEIEFEAQRAEGNDFFAGLTFPVKDEFCSLILGGWGGGVCGLSSLDRLDASENDTTSYRSFTRGQWYKVRLKVTDDRIDAWIDDMQIVDVELKNYSRISVRFEVERSQPLGFATYQTTARIRNARMRVLPKDEPTPQPSEK
ncbi:MAG: DUF1080 domain-containing protein [Planctomycetaceae bacterium]